MKTTVEYKLDWRKILRLMGRDDSDDDDDDDDDGDERPSKR